MDETSENNVNIKLGDIIEIEALGDMLFHNIKFFVKYIDIKKTSVKQTWIVCLTDLHGHDCSLPAQIKTKKIIKNINLNRLNLKLITL
jgi:hypothetical protein